MPINNFTYPPLMMDVLSSLRWFNAPNLKKNGGRARQPVSGILAWDGIVKDALSLEADASFWCCCEFDHREMLYLIRRVLSVRKRQLNVCYGLILFLEVAFSLSDYKWCKHAKPVKSFFENLFEEVLLLLAQQNWRMYKKARLQKNSKRSSRIYSKSHIAMFDKFIEHRILAAFYHAFVWVCLCLCMPAFMCFSYARLCVRACKSQRNGNETWWP